MAESADQASDIPAPPNVQPASKSEDEAISAKPEPTAADSNASWAEVLSAMRLAEDAVSKAVQGMADLQDASTSNNPK